MPSSSTLRDRAAARIPASGPTKQRTDPAPLQRDAQGLDHGWIIGTCDGDGRRLGSCVSSLVKFVEPRKRKHEVEDSRWQIPDGK